MFNYKSQKGQAIILMVFAFIGMIGMVGLTVDGGRAFANERNAQGAADAAVLAAALSQTRGGDIYLAADEAAAQNGYANDGSTVIEVHNPPTTGLFACATPKNVVEGDNDQDGVPNSEDEDDDNDGEDDDEDDDDDGDGKEDDEDDDDNNDGVKDEDDHNGDGLDDGEHEADHDNDHDGISDSDDDDDDNDGEHDNEDDDDDGDGKKDSEDDDDDNDGVKDNEEKSKHDNDNDGWDDGEDDDDDNDGKKDHEDDDRDGDGKKNDKDDDDDNDGIKDKDDDHDNDHDGLDNEHDDDDDDDGVNDHEDEDKDGDGKKNDEDDDDDNDGVKDKDDDGDNGKDHDNDGDGEDDEHDDDDDNDGEKDKDDDDRDGDGEQNHEDDDDDNDGVADVQDEAFLCDPNYIEVTVTSYVPATFGTVLGIRNMASQVNAIARVTPSQISPLFDGNAIVGLNPSLSDCAFDSGQSAAAEWAVQGGGIFSNGCAHAKNTNSVALNGQCVTAVGGVSGFSCSQPNQSQKFYSYEDIKAMMPSNPCDGTEGDVGIPVGGSLSNPAVFTDGVYCVSDVDGIHLDGKDIVLKNATLYITDPSFELRFAGGGGFSGSPTSTGEFSSYYLVVAPPENQSDACQSFHDKNSQVIVYRGNGSGQLYGTVLAPAACIDFRGNATTSATHSQIIAYNITSNGNAGVSVEYVDTENRREFTQPIIDLVK